MDSDDVVFSSDDVGSDDDAGKMEEWTTRWPDESYDDADTEPLEPEMEDGKRPEGDESGEEVKERSKVEIDSGTLIPFKDSKLEIKEKIGSGGYGQVYSGSYNNEEEKVAVKFAKAKGALEREKEIYEELQKGGVHFPGLPIVHGYGSHNECGFMVMQKLDKKLLDRPPASANERMKPEEIANIAIEAIEILKSLHNAGYVHADIKPGNFMYGEKDGKKLFLIDLGLAVKWKNEESSKHVEYDQHPDTFRGTRIFASVHAHLGRTGPKSGSRRDDLQSLAYTLLFLHCNRLPWSFPRKPKKMDIETEKEKKVQEFPICLKKMSYSPRKLSRFWPRASREYFRKFLDNVMNLKFEEEPCYKDYTYWFQCIESGSQAMPSLRREPQIITATPKQIITATPRWISTYNHQRAIKQRYHYNIPQDDKVLSRYVDKKSDDKVFISCACSYEDLLALIKREGNNYTDQVYSILANLDDRTWIEEKRSQDYCITALAGTSEGKLLVVMAKGTPFSNQLFESSETFPESFLKQNWSNGPRIITAMTAAGNNWAVVLSQCKGSSQSIEQVIEFDFCYPMEGIYNRWTMEGIYNRWRNGYRISLAAASENQIAFVLERNAAQAKDGRSVKVETQKMLLSEDFPGSRIKENWSKCFYVSSLCYHPR